MPVVGESSLKCIECGNKMHLYLGNKKLLYYRCHNCSGKVNAHRDGKPMGIQANRATRIWRIKCHDVFDMLWQSNHMTRSEAYAWMQDAMQMKIEDCHIGNFNIEQCKLVIKLAKKYLKERV